jgi:hypothetical protein
VPEPPTHARLHIGSSHPGTWLEGRSRVDVEPWRRLCPAPCDRSLAVEGLELRLTAPAMTPSNAFLVEPGPGVARFRVAGGSATARTVGIVGLAGGAPVSFVGMTLLGAGHLKDDDGLRTAGYVTLGVGAAAVLVSLPLLLLGSTSVKNHKGRNVAALLQPAF